MKNKFLHISSPSSMTRTTLITVYYYHYTCKHLYDEHKNFVEFLKSFKSGLDTFLESSGYQPFSRKNFFDLAVAFSSYAYLND